MKFLYYLKISNPLNHCLAVFVLGVIFNHNSLVTVRPKEPSWRNYSGRESCMPEQGLVYPGTKKDPFKNTKEVKALCMNGLYFQYTLFEIWNWAK
jgi:hypothetical protein